MLNEPIINHDRAHMLSLSQKGYGKNKLKISFN